MLRMSMILPCVALWCGLNSGPAWGDEPFVAPGEGTNSALVYWQAFSLLPEMSEEDARRLNQIEQGELPIAEAGTLLSSSKAALGLARHIKPRTPSQWELIENGPATLLPHLAKARLLARMMVLQARADASAGDQAAAVDRLAEALLVARNVDEGVLVQMLVGDAIESVVLDAAQPLVAELDSASAVRFSQSLANLPPRPTFAQAMRYQREMFVEGLRATLASDAKQIRAKLKQWEFVVDSPDIAALLAGSVDERMKRLDEALATYDNTIAAAKLPRAKAEAELQKIDAAIGKSSNPLTRLLLPSVGRVYHRHAEIDERLRKFRAALDAAANSAAEGKP